MNPADGDCALTWCGGSCATWPQKLCSMARLSRSSNPAKRVKGLQDRQGLTTKNQHPRWNPALHDQLEKPFQWANAKISRYRAKHRYQWLCPSFLWSKWKCMSSLDTENECTRETQSNCLVTDGRQRWGDCKSPTIERLYPVAIRFISPTDFFVSNSYFPINLEHLDELKTNRAVRTMKITTILQDGIQPNILNPWIGTSSALSHCIRQSKYFPTD